MTGVMRIYRVALGYPVSLDDPGTSVVKVFMSERLPAAVGAAAAVLTSTVGTWVKIAAHEGDSAGFMTSDQNQQELTNAERAEIARVFEERERTVYPAPQSLSSSMFWATNMGP